MYKAFSPEMTSLPCIGREFFRLLCFIRVLSTGVLSAAFCAAQSPPVQAKGVPHAAAKSQVVTLKSVKVISDAEGPAVEIVTSSGPAESPIIESLESPPRLLIDLPNTRA